MKKKANRIYLLIGASLVLVFAIIVVHQKLSVPGPGIQSMSHCYELIEDVIGQKQSGTIDDQELKKVYKTINSSMYSSLEGRTYDNGLKVIVIVLKHADFDRMDEEMQNEYLSKFYSLTQDHFAEADQDMESASAGGYRVAIIGTDIKDLSTKIEGHMRGMSMDYLSRLPKESVVK